MAVPTVLIADEDRDTQFILRAILERNGFDVIEASSADEAVLCAQSNRLDLIILNYPMSNVSGGTLVRMLRDASPDRRVPMLNLTSRVVPHFLDQATAEGIDVSLAKPLDVALVLEMVQRLTAVPA